MPGTNENNLDAYNEVATTLGGAGAHLNDMAAVRAIAVLEGVSGGPADVRDDNMTLRLNAIDVGAGGPGGHLNTLDALNSIVVLKGGVGGHENDLDAINEWVDFAETGFSSAFRVGIARVAVNTSTGNQVITIAWAGGGSHTPTAIEIRMIRASVDGVSTDELSFSTGAATATDERWAIAGSSQHGVATSDAARYSTDIGCVALLDPTTNTIEALADFVSFGLNTVTINWTTAPGTGYFILVTAYAGTDAAVAGTVDPSDIDAGTVDVETLGEAANYVMCAGTYFTDQFAESVEIHAYYDAGFFSYDGSTARNACVNHSERDARATALKRLSWSNTKASIISRVDGVVDGAYTFSTHANGFTVTTSLFDTNRAQHLGYLALSLPSGAEAFVGSLTTRTTNGIQATTAPGFKPQSLLLHSTHADVASTDTGQSREQTSPDADAVCFGSALSDSEFGLTIDAEDAAATMNTASRSDSKIATVTKTGGDTVAIQANLDSFDATGFTLNFTTVDATARNWVYCAFKQ